jgi:hypothetical protein
MNSCLFLPFIVTDFFPKQARGQGIYPPEQSADFFASDILLAENKIVLDGSDALYVLFTYLLYQRFCAFASQFLPFGYSNVQIVDNIDTLISKFAEIWTTCNQKD